MAHFKRKSDKIAHIQSIPLFSKLSQKELAEVARHCEEIHVSSKQVLANENKPGSECFMVVSGEITIRRNNRKLAVIGPGGIAGEMALLDDQPRSATLITSADSDLLVFSRRDFRILLDAIPSVSRKLLAALSERLRATDKAWVG